MPHVHPRLDPRVRANQPRLHPRRPPLRRAADEVQLGLGSDALVLRGLSPGQVAILERLDGSRSRRQLDELAARFGDPPHVVEELLTVLHGAGVMADPAAERVDRLPRLRNAERRILVGGPDLLTERVARALRLADVDGVLVGSTALDHAELALRDHDGASTTRSTPPDLVILSAYDALDLADAAPWMRHCVPHLAFTTEGDRAIIGPLVVPYPRADTTCLACIELHRCDRDRGRASVLAQTARPAQGRNIGHDPLGLTGLIGPGGPVRPEPTEAALLAAAASVVALVVAAYLCGDWLPDGVTVELTAPWPRLDHRRWPRHPHCPHHGRPESTSGARPAPTVIGRSVMGGE